MLAPMAKETAQKRTVTAENLQESARLKKLWEAKEDRPSQLQFGHDYDIGNQAAVGFFLNGQSALSLKAAKGFAKGLGCLIGDFSPRLAAEIAEYAKSAGIGWPFPLVDRSRWDALPDDARGYVQAAANRALDECASAASGAAWTPQPAAKPPLSGRVRQVVEWLDAAPDARRDELFTYWKLAHTYLQQGHTVQVSVVPTVVTSPATDVPLPTAKRGRNR